MELGAQMPRQAQHFGAGATLGCLRRDALEGMPWGVSPGVFAVVLGCLWTASRGIVFGVSWGNVFVVGGVFGTCLRNMRIKLGCLRPKRGGL